MNSIDSPGLKNPSLAPLRKTTSTKIHPPKPQINTEKDGNKKFKRNIASRSSDRSRNKLQFTSVRPNSKFVPFIYIKSQTNIEMVFFL